MKFGFCKVVQWSLCNDFDLPSRLGNRKPCTSFFPYCDFLLVSTILKFLSLYRLHRLGHHNKVTFGQIYAEIHYCESPKTHEEPEINLMFMSIVPKIRKFLRQNKVTWNFIILG